MMFVIEIATRALTQSHRCLGLLISEVSQNKKVLVLSVCLAGITPPFMGLKNL